MEDVYEVSIILYLQDYVYVLDIIQHIKSNKSDVPIEDNDIFTEEEYQYLYERMLDSDRDPFSISEWQISIRLYLNHLDQCGMQIKNMSEDF